MENSVSIIVFIISCLICLNYKIIESSSSTWISPATLLPRTTDRGMCIGSYNNTLYLLGGETTPQQVVEFNTRDNTFTDQALNILSVDIYGYGQFWTQIDSQLFMINPNGNVLAMYNLMTNNFTNYWKQVNIPVSVGSSACLTSTNDALYINGGHPTASPTVALDSTYILDLATYNWTTAPVMNTARQHHTCLIHPSNQVLYTIGGWTGQKTIERVSTINIENNIWEYLMDLSHITYNPRAVISQDYIVIIGGSSPGIYYNDAHIIDTTNDVVTSPSAIYNTLAYRVEGSAFILSNNIMYAFGGRITGGAGTKKYMYYVTQPTYSPTIEPTFTPTMQPTMTPSRFPTLSPTQCTDFDREYNSFDGKDIIINNFYFDEDVIGFDNKTYSNSNLSVIKYMDNDNDYGLFGVSINCSDNYNRYAYDYYDICFIGCYYTGHCSFVSIIPSNELHLKELKLVCAVKGVCNFATMHISNKTLINKVNIICSQPQSCYGLEIFFANNNSDISDNLQIHCNDTMSCKEMNINVHNSVNVTVICYTDNSCSSLQIITNNSPNINIMIIMFRFSSNILIQHKYVNNINITCGSVDEHRYIKYYRDTKNKLLFADELLPNAQREYEYGALPCQDITILCDKNITTHQCNYKYKYNNKFNLSKMLSQSNEQSDSCFWLDLADIYTPYCHGTCDYMNGDKFYIHNVTFVAHINFNISGSNKKIDLDLFKICDYYFSSINSTTDTLNSVDFIFDYVLNTVKSFDSLGTIHSLLLSPQSMLNEDRLELDCNISIELKPLIIVTTLQIESIYEKKEQLFSIFATDSIFVQQSELLISQLFAVPITLRIYFQSKTLKKLSYVFIIITVVGSCTGLLIIIIFFIKYKKIKSEIQRRNTYKKDINNPLVIFIGISFYLDDTADENRGIKNVHCDNLIGVEVDWNNMKTLCKLLNYDMFPKVMKLVWTQKEILDLLEDRAKTANESDIYDSILVVFSCHGVKSTIITSDYRTITKDAIHRIFGANYPNLRELPRIFLFDCCDGDQQRSYLPRDIIMSTSMTSMTSMTSTLSCTDSTVDADDDDDHEVDGSDEKGKNVSTRDVLVTTDTETWKFDENNPDFQLVIIHGANAGFQAKMDIVSGSYLITTFIRKMLENISQENDAILGEIMEDVQHELHSQGKQQCISTFNNFTRYLQFKKRKQNVLSEEKENSKSINEGHDKVKVSHNDTGTCIAMELQHSVRL